MASYTIGDALMHLAQHNAYHLGQIVMLRQMLGVWPPPKDSFHLVNCSARLVGQIYCAAKTLQ